MTRLSIDHLRSARVRREQYVGQWLPEPLLTDPEPDAAAQAETADSLSMAFLVLLESLTPVERAVFLLREVFDYDYGEIATIVERSEDNCRQLYVRARRHIDEGRPRFEASRQQRDELAQRFLAAAQQGDTKALIELLAADVVVYGDGGGKAPSWPQPIYGRERVAKLMAGTFAQALRLGASVQPTQLNGQPGLSFVDHEGRIGAVMSLEIADGVDPDDPRGHEPRQARARRTRCGRPRDSAEGADGALTGKPPERHGIRAVLRCDALVVVQHRLVGLQRRQADDTRTNPGHLGDVALERVRRPFAVVQKRDLETNVVELVHAVTLFRCVAPAGGGEELANALAVV